MYTSVELKGVWGDRSLEMMAFLVPGACALPRGYRRLPAEADRGGGGEVEYRPDVLRGGDAGARPEAGRFGEGQQYAHVDMIISVRVRERQGAGQAQAGSDKQV
jgi:hypothetical protein